MILLAYSLMQNSANERGRFIFIASYLTLRISQKQLRLTASFVS